MDAYPAALAVTAPGCGQPFESLRSLRPGRETGNGKRETGNGARATASLLPAAQSGFLALVDLDAALADVTPRLLAYAFGRTGCRSAAEDVVQDALAALVRRWRGAGPPESIDAFVFAIAKRRATRGNVKRALLMPLEVLGAGAGRASLVAERLEQRDEVRGVMQAIATLGRQDREVLLMRAAGEMSIEDIAKALGTNGDAIKMRLHRARQRLRKRLERTHAA